MLIVDVISTVKTEPDLIVRLLDVDVRMVKDIRDKVGLVPAIKVLRLLAKGCGLRDAMDYVKGL